MKRISFSVIAFGLLAGCASTPQTVDIAEVCQFDQVSFEADFEAARINGCERLKDGTYALTISPEDNPINPSPWYAFDVVGAKGDTLNIALVYDQPGKHRYSPKILRDGEWELLYADDDDIKKRRTDFILTPETDRVRVAGQPLFTTQDHNRWVDEMAEKPFAAADVIGYSRENRAIRKVEEIDGKKPYVVIVGRQHPPETTGAQALIPFVETVWGDSDLAKRFRANFNLLVIPMINPDGVANGHWRHNMGGLDLNRDWGPFTQPETQAVENELQRFKSGEDSVVFFLDFHSTWRNLIYTQTDEEPTILDGFTRDWVANVKARIPDDTYDFTREANVTSDRPVSKNYMYKNYAIPAVTFEVGDNTALEDIETASTIFAEEMMIRLLQYETIQ